MKTAMRKWGKRAALLWAILAIGNEAAHAADIDFSNLPGSTGSPFFQIQKDGFAVTAAPVMPGDPNAVQAWYEQHASFGNPPYIMNGPGNGLGQVVNAAVRINRLDDGLFTFDSVDLAAFGTNAAYVIDYYLMGNLVATDGATIPLNFSTISGRSDIIDELIIRVFPNGPATTDIELDNVRVTAVPEPACAAVVGMGLATLCLRRRRQV